MPELGVFGVHTQLKDHVFLFLEKGIEPAILLSELQVEAERFLNDFVVKVLNVVLRQSHHEPLFLL